MKKYVYKFVYKTKEKVLLVLMLVLFCFSTIINTLKLLELFDFISYNFGLDLAGLIFCILMILFICSTLFFSKYIIKDNNLIEYIGIFKKIISCEKITQIIHIKESKSIFIFYTNKQCDLSFRKINIDCDNLNDFIDKLRSINKSVLYKSLTEDDLR